MKKFVMFGQSRLFGDYVDLIHSLGGVLSRVVINVPDPATPGTKSFVIRLRDYQTWLEAGGSTHRAQVVELCDYQPDPDEICMMGFRGRQSRPLREQLQQVFGLTFPPLVHASASVSPFSVLGEGAVVCAKAAIASWVEIGPFCLVNRGVSIGHDTVVGPDAFISPNVAIASAVVLGEAVQIGIGATVNENLRLGDGCRIAAGAAVIADVPAGAMVAGVPAVVKKSDWRAQESSRGKACS